MLSVQVMQRQFYYRRLWRHNPATELKRQTGVLFYSLGKASFRFLAKLLDISPATTSQWVGKTVERLREAVVSAEVKEDGSSKLWIVTHGELWPGLSLVVMRQQSEDYIASF